MNIGITHEQALEKASPRLRRLMEHSYEVLRKGEKLALFYDPQDGYWCRFNVYPTNLVEVEDEDCWSEECKNKKN